VKIKYYALLVTKMARSQPFAMVGFPDRYATGKQETEKCGSIEHEPRTPQNGIKVLAGPALDDKTHQIGYDSSAQAGLGGRHQRRILEVVRRVVEGSRSYAKRGTTQKSSPPLR
jgi:hypothetical protein